MLITVIGRGHSGTRAMSHTLTASGVFMGAPLNVSGDLLPPEKMYEACRIFASYVKYLGGNRWDFETVNTCAIPASFVRLIEEYLTSVLSSDAENKGWKIPETTLVYPWIVRMFPDIRYIHWVRDPRDCILGSHLTDDLSDFGISYDKTGDIRHDRAVSWLYQREIMRAVPAPKYRIAVRFEDMVFHQDRELARLSEFLGFHMEKIPMRPDSVGRYKTDEGVHMFEFFKPELVELGYPAEES